MPELTNKILGNPAAFNISLEVLHELFTYQDTILPNKAFCEVETVYGVVNDYFDEDVMLIKY